MHGACMVTKVSQHISNMIMSTVAVDNELLLLVLLLVVLGHLGQKLHTYGFSLFSQRVFEVCAVQFEQSQRHQL